MFEETISYHDYSESFYHAILIGLLSKAGYIVESNFENGLGRSDIAVKDRAARKAVAIEVKVSNAEAHLEADCKKALAQIRENSLFCGGSFFAPLPHPEKSVDKPLPL